MVRLHRAGVAAVARWEQGLARVPRRRGGLAHASPEPTVGTARLAIDRAVVYLRGQQRHDGALRDFALEPGLSDSWMTAHVALVLDGVLPAQAIRRDAARFLYARGCRRGAWGFNDRVEEDADSTAQALLVLAAHGYVLPPAWTELLLGFQQPGGGFSTYRAPPTGPVTGWQASHPDVTLAALAAVRVLDLDPTAAARADVFLAGASGTTSGLTTAYWWAIPAYTVWAHARFGIAADAAADRARYLLAAAPGPLDVALLAQVAGLDGAARDTAMINLLATQAADGSWPCSPCLRVTDPALHSSLLVAPGPVYGGARRVFSTAHAAAALARLARL